ncbi:hypothetical protein ACTSKR_09570 [Chitinibacteraceae bacterium HSL-7]
MKYFALALAILLHVFLAFALTGPWSIPYKDGHFIVSAPWHDPAKIAALDAQARGETEIVPVQTDQIHYIDESGFPIEPEKARAMLARQQQQREQEELARQNQQALSNRPEEFTASRNANEPHRSANSTGVFKCRDSRGT